jgi:hypothetical protein
MPALTRGECDGSQEGDVRPPIAAAGGSGSRRGYPEPVAIRVFNFDLAPGQAVLVDGDPELRRNGVDVPDIQMDERVWSRVAPMFGEIEPNASAADRNEQREARLELMLPLFLEAESLVPGHGTHSILDIQNRDDLFLHAIQTIAPEG